MLTDYIGYAIDAVCVLACLLHFVCSLVSSYKQNKRIDKICDKCLTPYSSDEEHRCSDLNLLLVSKINDFVDDISKTLGDNDEH